MDLIINNRKYDAGSDGNALLLDLLREKLDLTGSKYGCGEGACGACTVLVDGNPIRSCITTIGTLKDKKITTIEGLEQNGKLHAVQEAFLREDPFQCAYCASGMIMASVALLEKRSNPSNAEIVNAMNGNICRCGTYPKIISAIKKASTL
ncbi:MAG TPA: (2Fe-2S)-binding protein [Cyclobacteriaceae bacterium]|nr:(2Fe-2S)-binding protein [Cyclobacteriaceae bacterium]